LLKPTFGRIDLKYMKAPESFVIEEEMCRIIKMPVFNGDQQGTAIMSEGPIERSRDRQQRHRGRNGFDGIESLCRGVPGSELP
jgi:malic enzyme